MHITRKCAGCKQDYHKDELVQYFSISGKTSAWYCQTCLAEKQARERFSNKVCEIFGLKSPGPRIWTERKRLRNKYGYTDNSIIDCLDYLYNVEHKQKLSESLALVTPKAMHDMKQYKASKKAVAGGIAAAASRTNSKEEVIATQNKKRIKKEINLDDGLFDD